MCPDIGTPKIINFPFGTNGKFIILGVPILKHITVFLFFSYLLLIMLCLSYLCKVKEYYFRDFVF